MGDILGVEMENYFFSKIEFFTEKGQHFSITGSKNDDVFGSCYEAINSLLFVLDMAREPIDTLVIDRMIDRLNEIKERQSNSISHG